MGIFNRKTTKKATFETLQTMGKICKHFLLTIELCDDRLIFYHNWYIKKKDAISLKYSQITNIEKFTQTELIAKDKSVIGQAVAGKLLFGDLGAQIGAIDATKPDIKKKEKIYMVIYYTSKEGEPSHLLFAFSHDYQCHDIYWNLRDICGITARESKALDSNEL